MLRGGSPGTPPNKKKREPRRFLISQGRAPRPWPSRPRIGAHHDPPLLAPRAGPPPRGSRKGGHCLPERAYATTSVRWEKGVWPLRRCLRAVNAPRCADLAASPFSRTGPLRTRGSAERFAPLPGGTGVSPVLGFITPFLAEPALSRSKPVLSHVEGGRGTGGWSKPRWTANVRATQI